MGLIRFIQSHNRNKQLKEMRKLKEQEIDVLENKEINHFHKEYVNNRNEKSNLSNPTRIYERAYEIHYEGKDIEKAYWLYKQIVDEHPDATVAKYAKQQIDNIENDSNFNREDLEKEDENLIKEENEKNVDDEAFKILKIRYAKGEITKQEFEQIKKDIEREK